jgi:hypothetical protein
MQHSAGGGHARVRAVTLAAAAALVLGVPWAATADATPAQRLALTKTNRSCDGAVLGPELPQPFGFVNLTRTGSDRLVASVVLQGGPPGTTYDIRLIQLLPGDADCGSATVFDGTLTTDDLGNGNANVQEPVLPGATSVWVDLNNAADFTDFFNTAPTAF